MEGFGNVNKNLKSYVKRLMNIENFDLEKYGKVIQMIYKYANNIIDNGNDYLSYFKSETAPDIPTKKFTRNQILHIVIGFLKEIDESLVIKFEEAIENGIFHFTDIETLNKDLETEDNFYYYYNLAGVVDGEYFTNIVMTYTIMDAFTIVHEFSHYCNLNDIEKMTSGWALFTEGYANFFECLFLEYCLKKEELKDEAICYYHGLLYSIMDRAYQFITQFLVFDVYLCHGRVDYKKIYKYCSDYEDAISLFNEIVLMIDEVDKYFLSSTNSELNEYMDDAGYIIGVPFAQELLENYPSKKEEILSDYFILNETNMEYYFEKYELDKYDTYNKVFCLNK